MQEFYDMDRQEKVRYVSESSNNSTSGYSTMSPNPLMLESGSPLSPSQSSATAALQTGFSHLTLPVANTPQRQQLHLQHQNNSSQYNQMLDSDFLIDTSGGRQQYHHRSTDLPLTTGLHHSLLNSNLNTFESTMAAASSMHIIHNYSAELRIREQPVDKFRFRYKSEMHGTHGSLNGVNTKRTPKTFPEVELVNYKGPAKIRCSLFQTNLDSPHSHQLVVRRDDHDVCDPHDLDVSMEKGYFAQFINMGIIHTAKKFIFEELLKKKQERLIFQLGRRELSTREMQELHKETERESKDMNLNQVRLCFEAFDAHTWTPIAAPVYTNPINNRKSAQTGELRIVRLSIAVGSVLGNDEMILLVEKVSKKNIKVRFFEKNDDDETVWEEYAKFRESDVHHQYAIICQTPAYRNKDIDSLVEVYIELVRPSDDERSYPPLPFRYKPRDAIVSRKRRRTCSTVTSGSGSAASSTSNSLELPKPVEEQAANLAVGVLSVQAHDLSPPTPMDVLTISEEFNKPEQLKQLFGSQTFLDTKVFMDMLNYDSDKLAECCPLPGLSLDEFNNYGSLEKDGGGSTCRVFTPTSNNDVPEQKLQKFLANSSTTMPPLNAGITSKYLQQIFRIYDNLCLGKNNPQKLKVAAAAKQIEELFLEHADKNYHGDTLIHEVLSQKVDNIKLAFKTFQIVNYFHLKELINRTPNAFNESGIHCACLQNRSHYIRPLVGLGCNPNLKDKYGNTAMHVAVCEEHTDCIESLLKIDNVKLDLKIQNDKGLTPLHLAILKNNFDVAKKLIKYDRSIIYVCNPLDGNNALHMSVQKQNEELVVLILDAHNVEDILTARNAAFFTALDLAKQVRTPVGNNIIQILEPCYKQLPTEEITVKEEIEYSTSDDEEESNETMDTQDELQEPILEIKEEPIVVCDYNGKYNEADKREQQNKVENLEYLLQDKNKFKSLAHLLDQKDGLVSKWIQLAEKSKMQHLIFLWKNATEMLNYVKTKSSNIEFNSFAHALADMNFEALRMLDH